MEWLSQWLNRSVERVTHVTDWEWVWVTLSVTQSVTESVIVTERAWLWLAESLTDWTQSELTFSFCSQFLTFPVSGLVCDCSVYWLWVWVSLSLCWFWIILIYFNFIPIMIDIRQSSIKRWTLVITASTSTSLHYEKVCSTSKHPREQNYIQLLLTTTQTPGCHTKRKYQIEPRQQQA